MGAIKTTGWPAEPATKEAGHGFTLEFDNGWSVSVQQSHLHYCTTGKTVEVAVFDPNDNWTEYSESLGEFAKRHGAGVAGHVSADELAEIINQVKQI